MFSRWTIRIMEGFLIGGLGLMVVLVFGNVVLRYGFNSGITVSEELSRYIFVWLTFIGAVLAMRDGGHLGMNSVVKKLSPRGKMICRLAADALVLMCCVLLVYGCWKQVVINADSVAPVSGIPIAVLYAAGLSAGLGIGFLVARSIWRVLSGKVRESDLIQIQESEEVRE